MQQENYVTKATANYLQADNEAKELLKIAPSILPVLADYGGEQVPKSLVIIQNFSSRRKKMNATQEFKQVRRQAKYDNGKLKFEMQPKKDAKGQIMKDDKGNELFLQVPVYEKDKVWQQVRTVGEEYDVNTLNVLSFKALSKGSDLSKSFGSFMNEVKLAITDGKPIKVIRVVNGVKKEMTINVKQAIRKNALCHLFIKIGDKVLSTIQVNGGIKGSEFYNNFSDGACKAGFKQLERAQNSFDGKPIEIDTTILTAMGLTKL